MTGSNATCGIPSEGAKRRSEERSQFERLRAFVRRGELLVAMPAMLVVAGGPIHHDPINKRSGGTRTGGVLPIPATAAPGRPMHLDSLLNGRRDTRAERGRVLYAPGHAPRDTALHVTHKHGCTAQRVIAQVRTPSDPAT